MQQIRNGIYLTGEALEALHQTSGRRNLEEVAAVSQEIFDELKKRYKQLNREGAAGVDSIIYTVERRMGKTEAVIKLAEELGLTIICENRFLDMYRHRKEDINIISLLEIESCHKWDGRRFNFHTVLVDEPTDAKRVRAALEKIIPCTLCPVNILGVQ